VTVDLIIRNWALVVAGILASGILLFVLFRLYEQTARGQLGGSLRALRASYKEAVRTQQAVDKAAVRLEELRKIASSVKPRLVEEAGEGLEDASSLRNIANDQVLIAEKNVRQLILDEFPPNRQDALRRKYLATDPGNPVSDLT
jgi:hypothetical protein